MIGTGRAADRDVVLDLGARESLDLGAGPWRWTLATLALDLGAGDLQQVGQVDVVFDVIGGDILERSTALVRPGGTLVTIAMPPTAHPKDGRAIFFVVEPDHVRLAESGWLTLPSASGPAASTPSWAKCDRFQKRLPHSPATTAYPARRSSGSRTNKKHSTSDRAADHRRRSARKPPGGMARPITRLTPAQQHGGQQGFVGGTRFELVTSSVSAKRSSQTELTARTSRTLSDAGSAPCAAYAADRSRAGGAARAGFASVTHSQGPTAQARRGEPLGDHVALGQQRLGDRQAARVGDVERQAALARVLVELPADRRVSQRRQRRSSALPGSAAALVEWTVPCFTPAQTISDVVGCAVG